MNDQLALGYLWRDVARRAARNNRGTDAGAALARVAQGIQEDVATFETLMDRLGLKRGGAKTTLGRVGAGLFALKPNGSLRSRSPLSRFAELEFLAIGIDGKKLLWATLRDLAALGERLPDVDFDALIERAGAQRDELEPWRERAGRESFLASRGFAERAPAK